MELGAEAKNKASLYPYDTVTLGEVGFVDENRWRLSDVVEILFLALRRFVFCYGIKKLTLRLSFNCFHQALASDACHTR